MLISIILKIDLYMLTCFMLLKIINIQSCVKSLNYITPHLWQNDYLCG